MLEKVDLDNFGGFPEKIIERRVLGKSILN